MNYDFDVVHLFLVPQLQLTTLFLLLELLDQHNDELVPGGGGDWKQVGACFLQTNQSLLFVLNVETIVLLFV